MTFGIGYWCGGSDENGEMVASLVQVVAKYCGNETGCDGMLTSLESGKGTMQIEEMGNEEDLVGMELLKTGRSDEIECRILCPSKNPPCIFGNTYYILFWFHLGCWNLKHG